MKEYKDIIRTKETVEKLTDYVNRFDDVSEEFNEIMSRQHRTLQQSFTKLCLQWLEHVASESYEYDLRNQASHEVANKIVTGYIGDHGSHCLPSRELPMI